VVADDATAAGQIDKSLLMTVPEEAAAIKDTVVKDAAITDATSLVFLAATGFPIVQKN
jgi:hypothetical protein